MTPYPYQPTPFYLQLLIYIVTNPNQLDRFYQVQQISTTWRQASLFSSFVAFSVPNTEPDTLYEAKRTDQTTNDIRLSITIHGFYSHLIA